MEGLILLIVIYFLFQAIVKRTKQAVQNDTGKPVTTNTQKPHTTKNTQPKQNQSNATSQMPIRSMMTVQEREKPYQPIQPSLKMDTWRTGYTGSLGGASQEGMVSREGVSTQEGTVSLEGETDREYQQMVAASAHYSEQTTSSEIPVVPTEWNENTLVQAVVAHEILAKPAQRWRS